MNKKEELEKKIEELELSISVLKKEQKKLEEEESKDDGIWVEYDCNMIRICPEGEGLNNLVLSNNLCFISRCDLNVVRGNSFRLSKENQSKVVYFILDLAKEQLDNSNQTG